MFLPIGDENPREKTPYVNYSLLAINIVVFLLFCFPKPGPGVLAEFAMIPKDVRIDVPSTWIPLFTSMFLHAGLLHVGGNMLFLWIFGDNVEDKLGHVPYLIFYLLCGLAADALHIAMAVHVFTTPMSTASGPIHYASVPTLGASGAIAGVLGAYLLFFPRHKVKVLFLFFIITIFRWPAWVWIGIWFLEQLIFSANTGSGVAYFAHIGGFVAGALMGAAAKFVVLPRRFRQADSFQPEELAVPSRWHGRPRSYFQPLTAPEEPRTQGVYLGPVQVVEPRFALLRTSDELTSVGRIASVASAVTGEAGAAIARRLNSSRGMILRDVARVPAERVQIELRKAGIPTLVVPTGPGFRPPRPVEADRITWDDLRLSVSVGAESQPLPWMAPFLYLGAVVTKEPLIDVYVTARHAFRATPRTVFVHVDPRSRREERVGLREFADAILRTHRGAAVNDGIRVLATRGSWGWLAFQDPEAFDDYSLWLYSLLLSRRPLARAR